MDIFCFGTCRNNCREGIRITEEARVFQFKPFRNLPESCVCKSENCTGSKTWFLLDESEFAAGFLYQDSTDVFLTNSIIRIEQKISFAGKIHAELCGITRPENKTFRCIAVEIGNAEEFGFIKWINTVPLVLFRSIFQLHIGVVKTLPEPGLVEYRHGLVLRRESPVIKIPWRLIMLQGNCDGHFRNLAKNGKDAVENLTKVITIWRNLTKVFNLRSLFKLVIIKIIFRLGLGCFLVLSIFGREWNDFPALSEPMWYTAINPPG